MPRYKPVDRSPRLLPVVLSEQIQPGTFEFALDHLVDHELNLAALDARFNNDETGASAYDPRVMLKIVLLAYSRGLISSRRIEHACLHHVQFIALSGDSQPSYTHIAKFVRELGPQIKKLFTEVLLTCDRMGLIGRQMFAIDGVKLPANASKERSGTHAELRHRAAPLDQAAAKIIALHQSQDDASQDHELSTKHQDRIETLRKEAQVTRDFIACNQPRLNRKGQELKTNITDPDSAKMATSKGVIQGYAAQAAVDSAHQVIVAAEVTGSGSEQAMLLPMVKASNTVRETHTLIMAFAEQAKHKAKPDPLYDKRSNSKHPPLGLYKPADSQYHAPTNSCICPAGQHLYSNGNHCAVNGQVRHKFTGAKQSCEPCQLRAQCLRDPEHTQVRQVSIFAKNQPNAHAAIELMKQAIDSPRGRHLYSQRIGTVEPVFGNIRHNKRLNRFTLRGKAKVDAQWSLYCLVHNIEKLANHGYAQ